MSENKWILERQSKHGFNSTVELLCSEAERTGWKIPAVHDLQQSLLKSGKTVKPVKVIEICKPEYSGKMLELNDERVMSVLMPCRISVYVKDDGNTYVALINTANMIEGLPPVIAGVMKAASDESFELIRKFTKM